MSTNKPVKLRHIVPNLVTVFALCVGLTSLRMSMSGNLELALYLIVLATFLDAADGKLARFLDTASPFGAELDSLSDFFNFGIAPGVLIFNAFYADTPHANIGWLGCLALAVACALRLARFNLGLTDTTVSAKQSDYFVGVPAPALACLALLPAYLYLVGWWDADQYLGIAALYLVGMAALAISTLPTYSIKHASVPRKHLPLVIGGSMATVVLLVSYPWQTLILADLAYLISIPFAMAQYKRDHSVHHSVDHSEDHSQDHSDNHSEDHPE